MFSIQRPLQRSKVARLTLSCSALTLVAQAFTIVPANQMGSKWDTKLGLSQSVAQSLGTNIATPGQRANSKVIWLLLASSREENPQKKLVLLKEARTELSKEGLPTEASNRILGMIEDQEKKAQARLKPKEETKTDSSLLTMPGTSLPGTSLFDTTLPVIVDLGSLSNEPQDTANGAAAPKPNQTLSPLSPPALSQKEVEKTLKANPEMRDMLWEIGRGRLSRDAQNLDAVVKDVTGVTPQEVDKKQAEELKEAYKPGMFLQMLESTGMNLDVSKENAVLKQEFEGVSIDVLAERLIHDATIYSTAVGASQGIVQRAGKIGAATGILGETVLTFVINANLVLRIADLYGVELTKAEKEIVLMVVFSSAKIAIQYGVHSDSIKSMISSFGQSLGNLKFAGKPAELLNRLKGFLKIPAVAKVAMPTGTPIVNAADTATKPKLLSAIASRINFVAIAQAAFHGTRSATETVAIGYVTKYFFSGMRDAKRAVHNDAFRRFLMTPGGEGFSKLLVLTMNDGAPSEIKTANARIAAEMKAKSEFIVNLARSARVCSEDEARTAKEKSTTTYACGENASTARFDRLQSEFLTFNEIPQDYVAELRVQSREHRLRMADLVLQMQFLDGDRTPAETQFFRTVVIRTLGVDSREDVQYFERLHAFIQDSGGFERSAVTPTGFAIRGNALANPYDMTRGYSSPRAPEPPPGVRYLESVKPSSSATSTSAPITAPVAAPEAQK